MKSLKEMTNLELKDLKNQIDLELLERDKSEFPVFKFEFNHTSDPRKGVPYAAKLVWNSTEEKIEREFFDLERVSGHKEVTVSGVYEARQGDIIEEREGGSWKNDYRYWYIIGDNGEKLKVANIGSSSDKMKVRKYLKGEIIATELF